jgi:hypothetical protein
MELIERFSAATCNQAISTSELQKYIPYHIKNAVRTTTNFGNSMVITLKDDFNNTFKVFSPKRYFYVFTDEHINNTNKEKIKLQIFYEGNCERTGEYALSLT